MRQAAPKPYENLQYADYPDKNGASVNALASKNIASNEAKKKLAKQINEELEPRVNEKTVDYDYVTRMAVRKAVEKAVEEFVDKAVDEFMKNINNIDKQTKP
jgi:Ni,Fe-hydrogenase I large subunit